jgi:teichoic acid transport system permease protein
MTAPAAAEGSLAEVAARAGLAPSAARPPVGTYLRDLWQRRHFIVAFASARNIATFADARLGQLWQVLTPLLNAGVYFLIFGVLLHTKRGVANFIGFLVIGIFIFTFSQSCILNGSRAVSSNLSLIRALHFPRAVLPLAVTVIQLQQLAVSMLVMVALVGMSGETPRAAWLLVLPALALQTLFNMGASLAIARVGARIPDVAQLLPFILRTWLYVSGVFYSIRDFTRHSPQLVRWALDVNPAAVYIELVRDAMLKGHPAVPHAWLYAAFWAVSSLVLGFFYFYRGEVSYGRG